MNNDDRNTCNNEDFDYMFKLLRKHEIVLQLIDKDEILLSIAKNKHQSIEAICAILNDHEITERNKNNRWVCYKDMIVFSAAWEKIEEEYVFGNPVKAITYYCENINKEDENKPSHLTGLHPESETLKQFLEISEKMTKVGLALTPEQENTLLHNVIDELSDEITRLKLKIEDLS